MESHLENKAKEMGVDFGLAKLKAQNQDNGEEKILREESPTNTNMRSSFIY